MLNSLYNKRPMALKLFKCSVFEVCSSAEITETKMLNQLVQFLSQVVVGNLCLKIILFSEFQLLLICRLTFEMILKKLLTFCFWLKVASSQFDGGDYCNKSECVIAASTMDVSEYKVKSSMVTRLINSRYLLECNRFFSEPM